jgi:hypothetical protein
MKKLLISMIMVTVIMICTSPEVRAQAPTGNVAGFTYLKMKHVDGGSGVKRDSLIAIYNANVTNKNEYVLSHREYRHFYTPNSTDYVIVEEYKDLASMEKANEMTAQLEDKAWPDKMKKQAFLDAMNAYFENWHGDGIFTTNPKLSKN